MDLITALAVVIGVMGGLATWAAVTVGSPYLLIWAIFIGWASFFHCGGKTDGLKASAVANVWGAICAAVAFIALLALGVTAINAGLCVGVTVVVMIAAAKVPALSAIPAGVYGYAATAGLFLLGSASYGEGNGAVIGVAGAVAVSMVIGNVLGLISEKIAGALLGGSRHKYAGGCAHIHTHSDAEPIDNHTCHCSVCKSVTGQLNTHVVFFKHGDLKVDHPEKLTRMPFNADNPNGPLELCVCNDCGTPIMLDDKEKRIRVIVPNLMGYEAEMPASYHAFYNPEAKGILPEPNDGRPVYAGLRPEFTWPKGA